jgi:GNAT superfamily N-acetyltransferase
VSDVTFRTLPFGQCADIVATFRNAQREAQRDAAYFDWRYVQRPSGLPAYVTLGFDATGQAVAAASLIPHDFSIAGTLEKAGMVGDVSVSESMRGHGLAARLIAQLRDDAFGRGLAACFVLPNKELTGALTRNGFQTVGAIRRAIRLLRMRGRLQRRLGRAGGVAGALLDGVLSTVANFKDGRLPAGFSTATPATFDTRYDALWARVSKSGLCLSRRDSRWLTWRFTEKPGGHYRIFELRRGAELAGYVVHHREDDLVYVDDFLAGDVEAADVLGRAFAVAARDGAWGDAIQVRYVEQPVEAGAIPLPFAGRYLLRADSQAVMWVAREGVPQARRWYVTPADKDV